MKINLNSVPLPGSRIVFVSIDLRCDVLDELSNYRYLFLPGSSGQEERHEFQESGLSQEKPA